MFSTEVAYEHAFTLRCGHVYRYSHIVPKICLVLRSLRTCFYSQMSVCVLVSTHCSKDMFSTEDIMNMPLSQMWVCVQIFTHCSKDMQVSLLPHCTRYRYRKRVVVCFSQRPLRLPGPFLFTPSTRCGRQPSIRRAPREVFPAQETDLHLDRAYQGGVCHSLVPTLRTPLVVL